jgi:hypothetical protein
MPTDAAVAIHAVAAELAEVMLPERATVLDPDALAAALADWHERRDRLAQDEEWDWPDDLDLRDAVLDLLLVFEDQLVYERHLDRAEAADDQRDVETWEEGLARCAEMRHALAERIATLIGA